MRIDRHFPLTLGVLALTVLCSVAQSVPQHDALPGPQIDDGRQWFEPDAIARANSEIRRAAIATAFNTPDAENLLRRIVQSRPTSDDASQAYELLSRIYLRSGQYSRLIDNFDRWAASFPNRPEVLRERADVEPFRGLPDQRNGPLRLSTLLHEPGNDWSVPLSINGKPASYLFDTGAWVSVMSEAEANRLGLEIGSGSATMGDPSGKGIRFRTAVAKDLRLGAMRFRNVSFAVPASKDTFGLLGIPLWLAVRHVKWSSKETWELGGQTAASEPASRNVVFSGNHLLLATSVSGSRVFAFFDTGAMNTDLNENFADAFPSLIQGGARETRDITGLGGTASVPSITVPEVPFQIGPTALVLRPAYVTLQRTVAIGGACCIGNAGIDVFGQTGEFSLDLSAMVLRLGRP